MNATNLNSSPPALRRYAAAALATGLVFGTLELAARWLAGTRGDNLHNPAGLVAMQVAARFTPAPSLLRAGSERAELSHLLFVGAQASLVALFLVLLVRTVFHPPRNPVLTAALLALQVALGVALDSLAFSLLATAQLAALLPLARGLRWLAAQFMLGVALDVFLVLQKSEYINDVRIETMLAVLTFERCLLPLAFSLVWLVRKDRNARLRLAQAHAQLQATQMLLGETVGASERMRIARDLHDSIGHHLTALNLHLDLALRRRRCELRASWPRVCWPKCVVSSARSATNASMSRRPCACCAPAFRRPPSRSRSARAWATVPRRRRMHCSAACRRRSPTRCAMRTQRTSPSTSNTMANGSRHPSSMTAGAARNPKGTA